MLGARGRNGAGGGVPFALASPGGLWDTVSLHARRGLQVESLGAGVLLAAHQVGGLALEVGSSAGSQNIVGSGADVVAALLLVAQVAVVVGIWIAFARGPADKERLVRYSAAAVCAFVILGKVLSPQFLIWLFPLVPLVAGRRGAIATGLVGLAAVLTQVWFPTRYWDLVSLAAGPSWLVVARDLVLLATLAVLVLPGAGVGAAPGPPAGAGSGARVVTEPSRVTFSSQGLSPSRKRNA